MTIDEISKLIIVIALSTSILGVSIQLMRLIAASVDVIKDLRQSVQNIGDLSDQFVEDYSYISTQIKGIGEFLKNFKTSVLDPMSGIFRLVSRFRSKS